MVLAKEIDSALRGTYVNKIYSAGMSQICRFRKPEGEDVWLVVSPKKGVWVSAEIREREETTEFTSKLRSELERMKFSSSSQLDLDRIFELDFDGGERKLVVELMPPGNMLVVDSQWKIRLALDEVRAEARWVVKGTVYQPPKQGRLSPLEVGPFEVRTMLAEEKTLGRALGRHVALPRKYVTEVLKRIGATDQTPSSTFVGKEEELAGVLSGMVSQARNNPRPCICETSEGEDIFAFPPSGLKVIEEAGAISSLCDRLFLQEAQTAPPRPNPEEARRKDLQATVAKLRRDSESLLAEASKARISAAMARTSGLSEALRIMRSSGLKQVREPGSPAAVASALYDWAKLLEVRSSQSLDAAAKLEKKMPKTALRKSGTTSPIVRRRGDWYEKFRWFFTTQGKLAVGGRDAQSNAILLRRHLDSNDTIYHADLFGSPFFILKNGDGQSDDEVRQVAQATVAFSSAWKTGLGTADAYWVSPDQVSAAAPSGEYLPRGSFAIRGKKNFVTKNLVELGVGVEMGGRLMAGPEEAVKHLCAHYVALRPQREKGSDTAKRVLTDLAAWSTEHITLDDVQRALPAGGGKILRQV